MEIRGHVEIRRVRSGHDVAGQRLLAVASHVRAAGGATARAAPAAGLVPLVGELCQHTWGDR